MGCVICQMYFKFSNFNLKQLFSSFLKELFPTEDDTKSRFYLFTKTDFFFLISTTENSTITFFPPAFFFHCFAIWRTGVNLYFFLVFFSVHRDFSVFSVFFKDIMYDQLHNPHNIAKLHWYFQSVYSLEKKKKIDTV